VTNQQVHISIYSVTYCYSSPHTRISVSAVTIISAAYNNNTINILINVQKCVTKTTWCYILYAAVNVNIL